MKTLLFAFSIFALQSSALAADKVKMGYHILKPHTFVDESSHQTTGVAFPLIAELFESAGYQVEWVGPFPLARLIEMLKEGSVVGALPFAKNSEREEFLYFPDKPIMETNPSFTVLKTNPLTAIRSVDDVKGYRVGFLKGAIPSPFLKNNASSFTIELLSSDNWINQNLNKLLLGRLDAVYDLNNWSVPYEAKIAGISDKIKILKTPEPPNPYYLCISKKWPHAQELYQKLNAAMNRKKFNYQDYVDEFMK